MNNKIVKGLAAISIADAEKIGTVARAYLDPQKMEIVGFVVDPGHGMLEGDKSHLIDVSDVHSLGPDALMVDDKTSFQGQDTGDRFDSLVDLDTLAKHKVVTEGGTFVGAITSIDFDETSFRLVQVETSEGFFKANKHIPMHQIVSIGNDLIIVADRVLEGSSSGSGESDKTTPDGEPRFERVVDAPSPARSPVEPAAASPAPPPNESPA